MSETMPQIESQPADDVDVRRAEAIADAFKAATAFLDSMNKTDGASPEEKEWARSQAMGILASLGNSLPAPNVTAEPLESIPTASEAGIAPEPVEPMFAKNNVEAETGTPAAGETTNTERKYAVGDLTRFVEKGKDGNGKSYRARVVEDEDENGNVQIVYLADTDQKHLRNEVKRSVPSAILRSMESAKPEKVETPKQPGWIATWINERKTAKLAKREQRAEEVGVPEVATEDIKDEAAMLDAEEADKEAEQVLSGTRSSRMTRLKYEVIHAPTTIMNRLGNFAGKENEKLSSRKGKIALGVLGVALVGGVLMANKYGLDADGFKHLANDIGGAFDGNNGTSAKASTGDVSGIQLGEVIPEPKKEPLPITDASYSFDVDPGHGYTHELVDYAQAHNANLSPEQSLDLHNHLVEKFGNYITDGGSYTQGGELRLGETGNASFKPGVVTEIDKYLSSRR